MQGFLEQRRRDGKWTQLFCRLKDGSVLFYRGVLDDKPVATFAVKDYTLTRAEKDECGGHQHAFKLTKPGVSQHVLAAEDDQKLQKWLQALSAEDVRVHLDPKNTDLPIPKQNGFEDINSSSENLESNGSLVNGDVHSYETVPKEDNLSLSHENEDLLVDFAANGVSPVNRGPGLNLGRGFCSSGYTPMTPDVQMKTLQNGFEVHGDHPDETEYQSFPVFKNDQIPITPERSKNVNSEVSDSASPSKGSESELVVFRNEANTKALNAVQSTTNPYYETDTNLLQSEEEHKDNTNDPSDNQLIMNVNDEEKFYVKKNCPKPSTDSTAARLLTDNGQQDPLDTERYTIRSAEAFNGNAVERLVSNKNRRENASDSKTGATGNETELVLAKNGRQENNRVSFSSRFQMAKLERDEPRTETSVRQDEEEESGWATAPSHMTSTKKDDPIQVKPLDKSFLKRFEGDDTIMSELKGTSAMKKSGSAPRTAGINELANIPSPQRATTEIVITSASGETGREPDVSQAAKESKTSKTGDVLRIREPLDSEDELSSCKVAMRIARSVFLEKVKTQTENASTNMTTRLKSQRSHDDQTSFFRTSSGVRIPLLYRTKSEPFLHGDAVDGAVPGDADKVTCWSGRYADQSEEKSVLTAVSNPYLARCRLRQKREVEKKMAAREQELATRVSDLTKQIEEEAKNQTQQYTVIRNGPYAQAIPLRRSDALSRRLAEEKKNHQECLKNLADLQAEISRLASQLDNGKRV